MAGPQEIDWDRLDKRKFFVVGVGMFSGVTTVLFPLTVIKTRQMAAHKDVAAGLSGTRQIAQQIWRQDGFRGFYRGFGTVVFGTIPARTVYMTSLEVTKAAVMRLGDRFDVTPAALAGAASFAGGAAASASTQAVVIPIDVISQRLMMHGVTTTTNNSTTSTSTTSTSSSASGSRGSNGVQQGQQQQRSYWTAASSSSRGTSHHAGTTAAASRSGTGTPSTTTADAAAHMQQLHSRGHHTSCQHAANTAAEAGSRQHLQQLQQPLQGQRLAQGLSQFTGSSGSSGGNGSSSSSRHFDLRPRHLSGAAAAAAVQQPVNGYQMARLIVQQEGIRGLYRGFWPSIATFVPQSSLWWGSYGFWQRTIWEQLPTSLMQAGSSSRSGSSSSGDGDGGSSSGSSGAASTGVVVAVQTSAAVLAGCSSTILTNPLDLVKTRLQVAVPVHGVVPSWRQVLRELLAEEGPRGLLRGVAPRMASSAMWGTAMVSVYEFLKRLCALPVA